MNKTRRLRIGWFPPQPYEFVCQRESVYFTASIYRSIGDKAVSPVVVLAHRYGSGRKLNIEIREEEDYLRLRKIADKIRKADPEALISSPDGYLIPGSLDSSWFDHSPFEAYVRFRRSSPCIAVVYDEPTIGDSKRDKFLFDFGQAQDFFALTTAIAEAFQAPHSLKSLWRPTKPDVSE